MLGLHLLLPFVLVLGRCQESPLYEHNEKDTIEKYDELRARWTRLHPATFEHLTGEETALLNKYRNQKEEGNHVPSIVEINGAGAARHIEGDILPSVIDIAELEALIAEDQMIASGVSSTRTKRVASFALHPNWPKDRPIPFVIDSRYSQAQAEMIRNALKNLEANSCVAFQENGPEPRLEYRDGGKSEGCSSYVGDLRGGKHNQPIYLWSGGCFRMNVVQHETMHALGFGHTQMRSDRDQYMNVNISAIHPNQTRNFDLVHPYNFNNHLLPYEYNSIMHYPSTDFSIDNKSPVLVPKKTDYIGSVGGTHGMTFNDWKVLNIRYKCHENCPADKNVTCLNNGYQHPRDCGRCACPLFFTGQFCQIEVGTLHVLPEKELKLNFKEEALPYPQDQSNFTLFKKDVHLIKAPEGQRIRITLERIDSHNSVGCLRECTKSAVEIVDEDLTLVGKRFCCNNKTSTSFLSTSNVVGYQVYSMPGWGFAADVTFSLFTSEENPQPAPSTTGAPVTEGSTSPRESEATTAEQTAVADETTTEATTMSDTAETTDSPVSVSSTEGSATDQATDLTTTAIESDATTESEMSATPSSNEESTMVVSDAEPTEHANPSTEGRATRESRILSPRLVPYTTYPPSTSSPNTNQSTAQDILDSIKHLLDNIRENIDSLANLIGW